MQKPARKQGRNIQLECYALAYARATDTRASALAGLTCFEKFLVHLLPKGDRADLGFLDLFFVGP